MSEKFTLQATLTNRLWASRASQHWTLCMYVKQTLQGGWAWRCAHRLGQQMLVSCLRTPVRNAYTVRPGIPGSMSHKHVTWWNCSAWHAAQRAEFLHMCLLPLAYNLHMMIWKAHRLRIGYRNLQHSSISNWRLTLWKHNISARACTCVYTQAWKFGAFDPFDTNWWMKYL